MYLEIGCKIHAAGIVARPLHALVNRAKVLEYETITVRGF